jgi:hypothetical protein
VVATDIDPQRHDIARLDFLNDELPPATRGAILATTTVPSHRPIP